MQSVPGTQLSSSILPRKAKLKSPLILSDDMSPVAGQCLGVVGLGVDWTPIPVSCRLLSRALLSSGIEHR